MSWLPLSEALQRLVKVSCEYLELASSHLSFTYMLLIHYLHCAVCISYFCLIFKWLTEKNPYCFVSFIYIYNDVYCLNFSCRLKTLLTFNIIASATLPILIDILKISMLKLAFLSPACILNQSLTRDLHTCNGKINFFAPTSCHRLCSFSSVTHCSRVKTNTAFKT